jgi:ABC-type polysaccharide/polyol phosphate transport system ATPase subunit
MGPGDFPLQPVPATHFLLALKADHWTAVMASIILEDVIVDFPVYGLQKSLRRALFSLLVPGAADQRVVVRALNHFSLTIRDGDRLGLIGPNGAGKTTLLRVLAGIYPPTLGRVQINGRISTLFTTSPGLDTEDTGYENIYTCGRFLGMSKKEIARKLPDIEEFCELGDYLALPVRTYSAGMLTRLGFAVATAIDPDILVLDEGIGAGDARFAERATKRIETLLRRTNVLILASHTDALIRQMCNRVVLLDHGRLICDGEPDEILAQYRAMLKHAQPLQLTVANEAPVLA